MGCGSASPNGSGGRWPRYWRWRWVGFGDGTTEFVDHGVVAEYCRRDMDVSPNLSRGHIVWRTHWVRGVGAPVIAAMAARVGRGTAVADCL